MKRASIRMKLIILISLVLIPVIILNAVRIRSDFIQSVDTELKASQELAEAISMSFMNYINRIWSNQYTMGVAIYTNPGWSRKDINAYLERILIENKEVLGYYWVGLDGTVLAGTSVELDGKSIKEREYFKRLMKGEDKVLGDLAKSILDDKPILPVARRIIIDGKQIGVVVSIINIDKLQEIFKIERKGKASAYGLIDRNGMIVYRNGSENLPYEKRRIKSDSPTWKALRGEVTRVESYSASVDNSTRMGVNYPISELGWACFVSSSVKEMIDIHVKDMERDVAVLFIISVCSFLIAFYLSNKLVDSINRIREAAEAVSKGEYNLRLKVEGRDELALTGSAMERMAEQVSTRITEAEEYSKLKSQFFSTVSHELKTPLNVILASTQIMEKLDRQDAEYPDKVQRYLGVLKQNSLRLLRLITNLIDINKLEVNHIALSPKKMDIVRVVEDITLSIVEYTKQKGIELIFDTEMEEKIISFDPDMIERIMLNLLSNAIKFTDAGGRIEVNIYDRQENIAISVKDTGTGIPEEMQEKIFNCFTQVDGSLRRKVEGSGIGLSLVKYLVELHEGSISLISDLGTGSEFIIELPNVVKEDEVTVQQAVVTSNVERIKVEFSDIYF